MNFNLFKNQNFKETSFIIHLACLLIHAARIDENFSEKEKRIIKDTLVKLGVDKSEAYDILEKAEILERDSNQILEYTKEVKNLDEDKKILIIEALWEIIYSDKNADIYETNLMRRLCGLLYLDNKLVGDIKEKIKNKI